MIVVGEKKYACESCIKGHRSSACKHNDRPLFEVKKKGRPVTQCEHCRELRKTKQVHVKCTCDGRAEVPIMLPPTEEVAVVPPAPPSNTSSGVGKKRVKKPLPEATFPAGIPVESLEASAALQALSEGSLEHHHRQGSKSCGCQSGQTCDCCVPRPRSVKAVAPQASSGPAKQPQYRPVLPRPPNARRLSDASHASMSSSGHDPSDPAHPHGGYGTAHRGNSFFNPYPRPFDYPHSASSHSANQGQSEYVPQPPPSATSDGGSVDDHYADYRSSPSLGYDFHHQLPPPAPPSGYADHQSQVQVHTGGYANGGGRAQPHHEAPFAPPQTPTDVPQPAWPRTLPQHTHHSQSQNQSFSALGVGIRPDHSAMEGLPPSVTRTPGPSMMDMDRMELCGCGPSCACPGCVEHRGPGNASAGPAAYEMCADPKNCGTCLQCSILSMPGSAMDPNVRSASQQVPPTNFDFGGGDAMASDITMQDLSGAAGGEYFSGIDEWLRSVGPPSAQYPPSFTYTPDTGSVDEHQQQQQQYQHQYQQAGPSRAIDGYERSTPSPAMYDYDVTFDPAMFASDPGGQGGMGMESLPELFMPDSQQQRGWRQSLQSVRSFDEDGQGRVTTFATSGERSASSLASASTSSLSSSYASSLGDPLPTSPRFDAYTYPDPPALNIHDTPQPQSTPMHHQSNANNNPELLVIPPTPAMRAGSGLGMSRNDTIDAAAENARYLAVREGSDGDGSSSPGSHYAAPAFHYNASSAASSSRRSTDNQGRPNISYPYPASVQSSSGASKMRSSSIFSGSSGESRGSASSAPPSGSASGHGSVQGQQQGQRTRPDPNHSKTANLPKNFNPFNVFPGAWGSRFSGKF